MLQPLIFGNKRLFFFPLRIWLCHCKKNFFFFLLSQKKSCRCRVLFCRALQNCSAATVPFATTNFFCCNFWLWQRPPVITDKQLGTISVLEVEVIRNLRGQKWSRMNNEGSTLSLSCAVEFSDYQTIQNMVFMKLILVSYKYCSKEWEKKRRGRGGGGSIK